MSLVNSFYQWAVGQGHAAFVPIPQRKARSAPVGVVVRPRGTSIVPATYAHDEGGERIEWLPPASYRCWRDVGIRGYGIDGLPSAAFRGRWAARNALFSDVMVRTGLRLSEQAHLLVTEVPAVAALGGYQRFWLPG